MIFQSIKKPVLNSYMNVVVSHIEFCILISNFICYIILTIIVYYSNMPITLKSAHIQI